MKNVEMEKEKGHQYEEDIVKKYVVDLLKISTSKKF